LDEEIKFSLLPLLPPVEGSEKKRSLIDNVVSVLQALRVCGDSSELPGRLQ
jgi:hypothetical protein